ncbi:MAG TPA: fumarylacetoacetate hydrolase family protein [Solirubrobacteraceae bacterium]|nr:fumarylacetoacetate hydrolase family protein [Solirubrobacteraceae bacterium]
MRYSLLLDVSWEDPLVKLATLRHSDGALAPAVVLGEDVVDLTIAAPDLPRTMRALLAAGPQALERAAGAAATGARIPLARAALAAPVPDPQKFLAVGLNYADHVAESGAQTPDFPTVFAKASSCVNGPYDDVHLPRISDKLDYEGELGFVIGTRCRHVPRERAHEVIAGYLIVDDFTVRDIQHRTGQWTLGKSFDTHGVIGPWIVTGDELGDPHHLTIRTTVNGETRQSSNTANLIFGCFAQVEIISGVCTLEPGDVIATGTPGGVGAASGRMLAAGDVVRVEVDGIGTIENRIVPEPAAGEAVPSAVVAA